MADKKVTNEVEVKVSAPGTAQAQRQLSSLGGTLKELSYAGKNLGLTGDSGIIGLLKGAGIAAGIKLAADAVRDGAKAWQEYREGLLSVDEAIIKAAKSIPLIGSIAEAAEALADATATLKLSDDERRALQDIPRQQRVKAGEEATAGALLKKAYGFDRESTPLRQQSKELEQDLAVIWEKLNTNTTILSENARTDYEIAFKKLGEARSGILDAIAHQEGSFVRKIRQSIGEYIGFGWRETAQKIGQAVKDYSERQRLEELDANIDYAQRLAKHQLEGEQAQAERDAIMRGEGDSLVDQPVSRYAPTAEGRFLTGAAGGGNTPEAQTAKNTAETNKKLDGNMEAIKDLARAIREGRGEVVYLR